MGRRTARSRRSRGRLRRTGHVPARSDRAAGQSGRRRQRGERGRSHLMWGELSILHVDHMSPPRSFYVGEATDAKGKSATDFLIGSDPSARIGCRCVEQAPRWRP